MNQGTLIRATVHTGTPGIIEAQLTHYPQQRALFIHFSHYYLKLKKKEKVIGCWKIKQQKIPMFK